LPGIPVSLSCDVLRQRREYERTATTVVNAYIRPVMSRYLAKLQSGLAESEVTAPLLIMQSAGGLTPADDAALRPVFAIESGPAAGVLASADLARRLDLPGLISFDMGGTTAKTSLIEQGRVSYSSEYEVGASVSAGNRLTGGGGELILAPSIDIAEVGAGGGSIAWLDGAGGLRVGPQSAGAVPGPVCYRSGGRDPTVTDANVVLGYLRPGRIAGGDVVLDADAAREAIEHSIARPMGIDVLDAARGVHAIANARMMRALREVSTQRGRDPRDFVLLAFGGSGPVHAGGLARELRTRQVIVPPHPGLFSAVGLLVSGIEHHDVRSCQLSGDSLQPAVIRKLLENMHGPMQQQFLDEGCPGDQLEYLASIEMRYLGQASQLRVDLLSVQVDGDILETARAAFEQEHLRMYGHRSEPGTPIEVIAARLVGRAPAESDELVPDESHVGERGSRTATFAEPHGTLEAAVVTRGDLETSTRGPLLIDEYDATIVVPPDMTAVLDSRGNIIMEFVDA